VHAFAEKKPGVEQKGGGRLIVYSQRRREKGERGLPLPLHERKGGKRYRAVDVTSWENGLPCFTGGEGRKRIPAPRGGQSEINSSEQKEERGHGTALKKLPTFGRGGKEDLPRSTR